MTVHIQFFLLVIPVLKFVVPYSLERYESVVKWDDGYLVVMAKYTHNKDAEEG